MAIKTRQWPADPERFPSTPGEEAMWRATVEWFGKPRIKAVEIVTDDDAFAAAARSLGEGATDREWLDAIMKLRHGMTNPITIAERIVRERGGDGTIVSQPASPFNFIGEPTRPLTPTRNADGSVTWEHV